VPGAEVMSSFSLTGRRAVVTGAGSGIGEACALALAEAGADVALVSRTRADLDRVARLAEAFGVRASPIVCDVTDRSEVEDRLGGIAADILVNSAGSNIPEAFLEVSREHLDAIVDLNVKATFHVTQTVARRMVDGGGGSIVNISSQMGHVGAAGRTVYCMTKHAVEGFTKALAVELATSGVRVNSVAPTFIETRMTRPFFADPVFKAQTLERIPLGRLGSVRDVVGAVIYLASEASSLVTGTSVLVDGGYTAQ
jgi:NAD(P)-dependent dehydrogenase (short-subunit alcohol dehydrogenase family)